MILVVGDGNGKGIRPVKILVCGIEPGTGCRINGCGSVGRNRRDLKVGPIGEPIGIGGVEITGGIAIFHQGAVEVTGDKSAIVDRGDGQGDRGQCGGMILVVGDGNGKGIRPVKVLVCGIEPGTGCRINRCGPVGGGRGD